MLRQPQLRPLPLPRLTTATAAATRMSGHPIRTTMTLRPDGDPSTRPSRTSRDQVRVLVAATRRSMPRRLSPSALRATCNAPPRPRPSAAARAIGAADRASSSGRDCCRSCSTRISSSRNRNGSGRRWTSCGGSTSRLPPWLCSDVNRHNTVSARRTVATSSRQRPCEQRASSRASPNTSSSSLAPTKTRTSGRPQLRRQLRRKRRRNERQQPRSRGGNASSRKWSRRHKLRARPAAPCSPPS